MKLTEPRLDHIGITVREPRERLQLWSDLLGLPLERAEVVASEGVRTWFLNAGGVHLELLEALDEDGPVARHLDKRGEGIHHICLAVDDLDAHLAALAARGIEALSPGVRPGAGGRQVAFLHPKATGGVLLELSQPATSASLKATTPVDATPFASGRLVIAYLRDPREQIIGALRSIDGDGIAIEGLGIDAWDDWISQWARGDQAPVMPSLSYFPMMRVSRLLADRDSPELPSFARRFEERTGRSLVAVLNGREEARP